tara:strand:+ start:462 stop:674 length:213 start_codon:yes stop_codon:yes gene_type:complete
MTEIPKPQKANHKFLIGKFGHKEGSKLYAEAKLREFRERRAEFKKELGLFTTKVEKARASLEEKATPEQG